MDLDGTMVKVAVVHGLANARKVMELVREGKADYQFVEVMSCPGGCIGGGGNPPTTWKKLAARRDAIYQEDRNLPIRKSHENPYVQELYREFLGEPLSEKSHELLHTHYISRRDLIR